MSCHIRFSDNRPAVFPFGEDATGRLIYQADGWMSATLSRVDRAQHADVRLESAHRASLEERVAAYDSYLAYDGRWRVEPWPALETAQEQTAPEWGRRGVVTHEVVRALTPNTVGVENTRFGHLTDGVLTLSYSLTPRSGVRRDYELQWRRVDAAITSITSPAHAVDITYDHPASPSLPELELTARAWFTQHQGTLASAVRATRHRQAWSPFIESPSRKLHPEGARELGLRAYQERLNRPFRFSHPLAGATRESVIGERSPYSGEALNISYPRAETSRLYKEVETAWETWRWTARETRAGVCLELLTRWAQASFEIAYATMNTAGQGFMLAFAGSGASSLDRGLEALAAAWIALEEVPESTQYERRFGGSAPARLRKRYLCAPVGPAVVFSCGSYPAWNAYPAMMANLLTGNPVIVKPHPQTILPVAIAVEIARATLSEAGFDPNLITLAPDTWDAPIGLELVDHPRCAIVDFTGGQRFGALLERRDPRLQVYTETAGCNAVILHSTDRLDELLDALAQGLSLFSAQMCTAPQNLWVSERGFKVYTRSSLDAPATLEQTLTPEELGRLIAERVDALLADPVHAAGICGAIHSEATLDELSKVRGELRELGQDVIREGGPYAHPEHPKARTATPLIGSLNAASRAPAQSERFGPISFLITAQSESEMTHLAAEDARRFGSIAAYAYSVDETWIREAEHAFLRAGASIGVNLYRQRPMNFTAAFSDFHVTGLNPAGTASLTDPGFVSRRFRVVQVKREVDG